MPEEKQNITVIIAVLNESANIERCLQSLDFVDRVIVVDSASSDRTTDLAKQHGAEVVQFQYEGGYPKKRQWALDTQNVNTGWVLLLDADEVIPDQLKKEISTAIAAKNHSAFLIKKGFHFMGKKFRFGGFSHSAVLLFKTGTARFEHLIDESSLAMDMEVHERLITEGSVGQLPTPLIHEDYKGLEAYLDRHNKYSTWEAKVRLDHLSKEQPAGKSAVKPNLFGDIQQRRRFLKRLAMKVPCEHLFWFFYHYVLRLGILEGRRGLIASRIRCSYIANVRAKIYEMEKQSEYQVPHSRIIDSKKSDNA